MKPFSLLIKPSGPDCNIDCTYCFYTPKKSLFDKSTHRMDESILTKIINDYLAIGFRINNFAWQGGEPTLMGIDFFRKAVEIQQRCAKSCQSISNTFQTNGILLNSEWCKFFNENRFLVGISLDGPQKYHDYYRRDQSGKGTFERVIKGINECKKNDVEFNILVLLNDKNVVDPDGLFDFFVSQKIKYLQFIPCFEREPITGQAAKYSVKPELYGKFIVRIFELWKNYGVEKLSIRLFDSIMHFLLNQNHTDCTFGWNCDAYIVIEHNGDAYCCDFFVEPEYRLGNINDAPLEEIYQSKIKENFASNKKKLSGQCLFCEFSEICRRGCLKDRPYTNNSAPNYFCESYKTIFKKILPDLKWILASKLYDRVTCKKLDTKPAR